MLAKPSETGLVFKSFVQVSCYSKKLGGLGRSQEWAEGACLKNAPRPLSSDLRGTCSLRILAGLRGDSGKIIRFLRGVKYILALKMSSSAFCGLTLALRSTVHLGMQWNVP